MGGWTRALTHLDGHEVVLSRAPGEVVQPGAVDVLPGEGMPVWRAAHADVDGDAPTHGCLHVEYVVVLPDLMDQGVRGEFAAVWDGWRARAGGVRDEL